MPDYGTVTGFRTYHSARGRDTQLYDDTDVEAAKLVASEAIDARYRALFPGLKVGQRAQVREWPRSGGVDIDGYAIPSDVVPTEIENATYELTLRQLVNPGSLSVDWTPGKYKSVSIDGAVSVTYAQFGSANDVQGRFQVVDEILAPILTGSRNGSYSDLSGPNARV